MNSDNSNVQNSKWGGIITISSSYIETKPSLPGVMIDKPDEEGNGLYTVTHEDSELAEAGWKEPELRYAGPNPDNYVNFNNEKWRIIGLVNVKTTNGIEQRLKIIREDKIGDMAWDENNVNDWTKASLMKYLNGDYYNNTLNGTAKSMIDKDVIWNLGGTASYTSASNGLSSHWYGYERGTKVYEGRPTEWGISNTETSDLFQSIALPYPSDYGYATSGGSLGREGENGCFAKELAYWSGVYKTNCAENDWLKPIITKSSAMWTLSPVTISSESGTFFVDQSGNVDNNHSNTSLYGVWPTIYLKPEVEIIGGSGTVDDSFELGYNAIEYLKDIETVEDGDGLYLVEHKEVSGTMNDEGFNEAELRYAGENPNNYVTFNGEEAGWRIIGLVNVLTEENKVEHRIKLVRAESLGTFSWDSSGTNVNKGLGVNEWSQADLMKLLNPGYEGNLLENENGEKQEKQYANNSLYWNSGIGSCYSRENNGTESCDFQETGLKENSKKLIAGDILWNTGAYNFSTKLVEQYYNMERGTLKGNKNCTLCDNVERYYTWNGKIGLLYASDYGYGKGGENKTSCITSVDMLAWSTSCNDNNWLLDGEYSMAMLTPATFGNSATASVILQIRVNGSRDSFHASSSKSIYPTLYLKPDVMITGGTGEENSPYELSIS